jgi:hypothetical protein
MGACNIVCYNCTKPTSGKKSYYHNKGRFQINITMTVVLNDGGKSYGWKQNRSACANSGMLREHCQINQCGDD